MEPIKEKENLSPDFAVPMPENYGQKAPFLPIIPIEDTYSTDGDLDFKFDTINRSNFRRKLTHCMRKALPFFILLAFSLLGGWMFFLVEGTIPDSTVIQNLSANQTAERVKNETVFSMINIIQRFHENGNKQQYEKDMYTALHQYANTLKLPSNREHWTFAKSMVYAGTLYTTIGYGSIHPTTIQGQVLTILYAIGGIPLFLYAISQLGKILVTSIYRLHSAIRKKIDAVLGKKTQQEQEFPFSLAILLTLGWIHVSALFHCISQDWDFFTSVYFYFISITTIGLGDVMPSESWHTVPSFIAILIGLALLSMCWNLVQLKLDLLVEKTIKQMKSLNVEEEASNNENSSKAKIQTERESLRNRVHTLVSEKSNWLTSSLLSDRRKQALSLEWQKRLAYRNQWSQTENLVEEKFTQSKPKLKHTSVQAGYDFQKGLEKIPYRETATRKPGQKPNEIRELLEGLSNIIDDCTVLLDPSKSHTE